MTRLPVFALALLGFFWAVGGTNVEAASATQADSLVNVTVMDGKVPHPRLSFSLDNSSPQDLGVKVTVALSKRDVDAPLEPEKCARKNNAVRACGTLRTLFEALRVVDPESKKLKTIADLPGYLGSLKAVVATDREQYWSACVVPERGGKFKVYIKCVHRKLEKGERKWMNPETGRFVMFAKCANPSLGRYRPPLPPLQPCVTIHFRAGKGDLRVVMGAFRNGEVDEQNSCWAYKAPGDTAWRDLVNFCPAYCDLSQLVPFYRKELHGVASIPITENGEYIVRVPREAADAVQKIVIAFCLEREGDLHSDSQGVEAIDYKKSRADLLPWQFGVFRSGP